MSQNESVEQPPQADDSDLRSELSAAFDRAESPPAAEDAGAPTNETAKAERARDEAGRFAKKAEGSATDGSATAGAETPAPDAGAAAPGAGAAPAVEIPKNWPAETRADLEALAKLNPALAKRWIDQTNYAFSLARTERERAAPFMRLQQSLEDVLAPTRQQRQMAGMDDAAYLRAIVAADQLLQRDPRAGIKWLAQKYGITPEQLVESVQDAAANAPPREVVSLQQEVEGLKNFIASMQQGAQQQALAGVTAQIEAFASATGPDGSPLHPHFDECLADIQVIVQAQREMGQPVNLQAAYEKAVRMNDAVWMRVQSQRAERDRAERAAAAEKAKRAGFNVTGSGTGASEGAAGSLREELERQIAKHS